MMYQFLDNIQKPEDVKKLNIEELSLLAEEIRSFLIESVSKTGGHLASNLGVVELTLALFKTLDMPKDSVVWDVGHQTYVHKLLTGRKEQFSSLRQFGGLSGFPKTSESEYDAYNTGHSSTSVSAALGMTKASELLGDDRKAVAVIGDGALTGGMAFEALNDAGDYKKNFIVILNDNEMSISKNVGGLSRYLTKLRTNNSYSRFKSGLEHGFEKVPGVGKPTLRAMKHVKDNVRHLLMSSTVFEDLGFTYLGPIDGHDLTLLCRLIERAKSIQGPVLIHIITKKGKGYKFAEDRPSAFHGVSAFEIETGTSSSGGETYSACFGSLITELAKDNSKLCTVTAAMQDGTGLSKFKELYPDRCFDVGIAEQHAVTFAAGLSKRGLKPVVALYSSFMQRAYDQILHDVCLQNLDMVFCIDRAGLVGEDGETHQGIYDLAILSQMPNMTILSPANFTEFGRMLTYAVNEHKGPIAIRYPRGGQVTEYEGTTFQHGKYDVINDGSDVCIFSAGHMLQTAIDVKEKLSVHGISVSVVNMRTLWPLDEVFIRKAISKFRLLVTLEDGVQSGGIGEKLSAFVTEGIPVLVKAHKNGIVPHGARPLLYKLCGLDCDAITEEIIQYLQEN